MSRDYCKWCEGVGCDCSKPDPCPRCKSDTGLKYPRDDDVYCEDCGWPDEDHDETIEAAMELAKLKTGKRT